MSARRPAHKPSCLLAWLCYGCLGLAPANGLIIRQGHGPCKGEYHWYLFSRIVIGISGYGPGIGIGQYLTLYHIGISQLNPIRLTGIKNYQKRHHPITAQVACYCYSLWPTSSRAISSEFYLPRGTILPNSTFLCAQAMRHTMGLHKPQATSEHDLHIKRFVSLSA